MAKSKAVVPAEPLEKPETETADIPETGNEEAGGSSADDGAAAVTEEPVVQLIYIGPQLPRTAMKPNTVITGTEAQIKAGFTDVFKRFPLAEYMLVPVDGLADRKEKVKTAGTLMNKYYADLVSAAEAIAKEG